MSNLMADPNFWTPLGWDITWDGTQYSSSFSELFRPVMTLQSSQVVPDPGTDVIAGEITVDVQEFSPGAALWLCLKEVGSGFNLAAVEIANQQASPFSFTTPAGIGSGLLQLFVGQNPGAASPTSAYGYGFTLVPLAVLVANDDAATTPSNTPVNIPVLANDTLGENPVQLANLVGPPTVFEPPANGSVEVQADGSIVYTPNPGFTGVDTFEYEIETPDPCTQLKIARDNSFGGDMYVSLASGQDEPEWWGSGGMMLLPSGEYQLFFDEFSNRYYLQSESYPSCITVEDGTLDIEDGFPICVQWLCAPALLNLGCSWEPRGNEPSTDDSGGIAFKPDWFVDNDPFTVSDPINGWTETWQWNGSPDFYYTLLSSTGTSTRPNCCGDGSGLTLTQGSNTVDLDWRYNCG